MPPPMCDTCGAPQDQNSVSPGFLLPPQQPPHSSSSIQRKGAAPLLSPTHSRETSLGGAGRHRSFRASSDSAVEQADQRESESQESAAAHPAVPAETSTRSARA